MKENIICIRVPICYLFLRNRVGDFYASSVSISTIILLTPILVFGWECTLPSMLISYRNWGLKNFRS